MLFDRTNDTTPPASGEPSEREEPGRLRTWSSRIGWTLLLFVSLGFTLHLFNQQASRAQQYSASSETAFASSHEKPLPAALQEADGKQVYMTRCVSCHQTNGKGISGVFPPLDGSEWVVDDKGRLVRIILNGLTGEIEVDGTTYSGAMPPWGMHLSDAEVAALSTYIRTSWSNDTTEVTTEEVKKVREAVQDRKNPWTAKELKQEAHSGIPGVEQAAN